MEQRNFPYDAIYKAIFSEKQLVKSLLLDFVKLPFVADFDFSTLERFPGSYATPAFTRHENDLVWRVEMNGHDCLIYIMLEFQSHPEKYMAARIAKYSMLLLDSLIDQDSVQQGLPPIFPLVVYNGATKWQAPTSLTPLFMPIPAQLRAYQPNQKYFLLDIRHLGANVIKAAHGEASFFVRLERSSSPDETRTILKEVIDTCAGPQYDRFRRLLRNFVLCCLERGSWDDDSKKPMPMEEFEAMYDNYPQWVKAPWEDGKKEGIREGKKEGKREVLGELAESLSAKLAERFGSVPKSWAAALGKLKEPQQIIDLTGAAYTAQTPGEFEAALLKLAQA